MCIRDRASIKKTADEQLQKKNLSKADYLALAYLMTDEKKYADKLKEILLDVIKEDTWGSEEMLARIPVSVSYTHLASC